MDELYFRLAEFSDLIRQLFVDMTLDVVFPSVAIVILQTFNVEERLTHIKLGRREARTSRRRAVAIFALVIQCIYLHAAIRCRGKRRHL